MVLVGVTLVVVVDCGQKAHLAQIMALVLLFDQCDQMVEKEVDWLILVEDH